MSVEEELKRFQNALVSALRKERPDVDLVEGGRSGHWPKPKAGAFHMNDEVWGYSFHGAGVRFVRISDLLIVDMHDHVDNPDYVDEYRLELYRETADL